MIRSYLFVPGTRPERFAKARASGAHAVIVDLEDAVAPADKEHARDAIGDALSAAAPLMVRINGCDTPWFEEDVALAKHSGVAAIVLPKAEHPDQIARIRDAARRKVPVLALIETARGLRAAESIARAEGVARLAFGSIDFQADCSIVDEDLLAYRAEVVLASRLANLEPPADGITTAIDDEGALLRDTRRARSLGFGAKLCIHPKQVGIVNAAFLPTAPEIAWAERVVAADAAAQGGATTVDGKMVDRPVLLRAQAILAEAKSQRG